LASSIIFAVDDPTTVFNRWDKNHGKMLSPEEFCSDWSETRAAASVQRLRWQFTTRDTDKKRMPKRNSVRAYEIHNQSRNAGVFHVVVRRREKSLPGFQEIHPRGELHAQPSMN
jgi:hypothetical protein